MDIYCTKCGNEIPEGSKFCLSCGETVGSAAVPAKKNGKKTVIIIVAIVLALAIIGGIIAGVAVTVSKKKGIEELSRKLTTIDWSRVEVGENDTYYTLRLDFNGSTIDYDFDSFYIDERIMTYNYEVISANQIKVEEMGIITIEFSDDMFVMTMTPALTRSSSSEFWYNHDN